MSNEILIDNDVVIKSCQLLIDDEVINILRVLGDLFILSVSAFVISSRVAKKRDSTNLDAIKSASFAFLNYVGKIEPTEKEIELAADLEVEAGRQGLELDIGESQLLAIFIEREAKSIITGDKRAIRAIEHLVEDMQKLHNKVACFEQLIFSILEVGRYGALRSKICEQQFADKAIALCFSCKSPAPQQSDAEAGLLSYICALREEAPKSLLLSNNLSALST
jgi:hypothetical protein